MSTEQRQLLQLQAMHDQDEAAMMEWWKSHTDEQKKELWIQINILMEQESPAVRAIAKLASFALTVATLKSFKST